ncbi:hypothetical protein AAC387_Pa01g2161 [Persea americana]
MSSGQNPKNVQRPYPLGFVANQSTGPLWPATVAGQWPVQVLRTAAKLLVQRPTAVHSRWFPRGRTLSGLDTGFPVT